MSEQQKRVVEPYNLVPAFERALVHALCCRPKFYARIGTHVDSAALGFTPSRLALQAAAMIAKDQSGTGPDSTLVVLQRLRRWMEEGKTTQAELESVAHLFDAAEDAGLLTDESLSTEIVPVLKRRLEMATIEDALGEFQRKGEPAKVLQRLERVKTLGVQEVSLGTVIGSASFDQIARLQSVERLRLGILELDDALDGGPMRGTATAFVAGTGGGKSVAMVGVACTSAVQGFLVAVATLELPVPVWTARVKACLTNVPINAILVDPYGCGAIEAFDEFAAHPLFGNIVVREFTPKATTMQDLKDWIKDIENEHGRPVDVLVIDYADKMKARGLSERANENSYQSSGSVYDDIYTWARDERRWAFTGSQSRRNNDTGKSAKAKTLDVDDVSDSMGKARNFDMLLTLNPRDDGDSMAWKIAKNRLGRKGHVVGPLPCDFTVARIGPIDFTSLVLMPSYTPQYGAVVALKTRTAT